VIIIVIRTLGLVVAAAAAAAAAAAGGGGRGGAILSFLQVNLCRHIDHPPFAHHLWSMHVYDDSMIWVKRATSHYNVGMCTSIP